jgi:Ca2+-binding EF-hand superfamily protein
MPLPILFLPFAVAAAQPSTTAAVPAAPPRAVSRRARRMFVSPMGEPFTADRGGDALAVWFGQADRNHDGTISKDEMQQDAERFFATLDVNHDGEIDPDEITRYETQIAPANRRSLGLLPISEPVATADSNFNRGVTLNEFRTAADKRFGALDMDKRGLLTLDRLEDIRPEAPARQRNDPNAPQHLDPNADSGG